MAEATEAACRGMPAKQLAAAGDLAPRQRYRRTQHTVASRYCVGCPWSTAGRASEARREARHEGVATAAALVPEDPEASI